MKTTAVRMLHFLALALTIAPCKSHALVLTEHASGSSIKLIRGDALEIALRGNASTGFLWEVAPGAEAVLLQQGEPHFAPDSGLTGAGGTYTFVFRAVAAGEAPLILFYRRPWEKAPLKEFKIQITVRDH